MWRQFEDEDGGTIGRRGSEDGIILRDEEHDAGARITLERECGARRIPFAITCGIYGWFVHTRFLGPEAEVEFPAMQEGLAAILDIIPYKNDPDVDAKMISVGDAVRAFVDRFP